MHAARLQGIRKAYGPEVVLDDVDFDVLPGEVHVLAGENGAGKSTLIKVLGGIVTDYTGQVEIAGQVVRFRSAFEALRHGVAVIHQELSLIPAMSVLDNLFLGDMPARRGWLDRAGMTRQGAEVLARVGLSLDLDELVERLPIGTQQLVEIAKALRHQAKVLVMDEPTSALNAHEAERLFALVSELKSRSVGIVYITHKMEEIARLADRITVLRDGKHVATRPARELPGDELVRLMVGRREPAQARSTQARVGDVALRLRGVSVWQGSRRVVHEVELDVRAGEVVGLAGLEGSGNSALLLGLFGGSGRLTGEVELCGAPYRPRGPGPAIGRGLALLTNDRKATGLVLPLSFAANVTLPTLRRHSPWGWRSRKRELAATARARDELRIRAANPDVEVRHLSGGNQQKVALAKWVQAGPRVLLLDEPTRGIDVGAKREVYAMIENWKAQGMAILLITSELPELLLLSDRLCVMHRGRVTRRFAREDANADEVIRAAMNA